MINEMRWFGGYKSLLELMQIYVVTLLVMLDFLSHLTEQGDIARSE